MSRCGADEMVADILMASLRETLAVAAIDATRFAFGHNTSGVRQLQGGVRQLQGHALFIERSRRSHRIPLSGLREASCGPLS